jgi:hypothetical protein
MNNTVFCYKKATKLPSLNIADTPLSTIACKLFRQLLPHTKTHLPATTTTTINRSNKVQARVVTHDC